MRKVFVGSLSWNVDDQGLSDAFAKFGEVEEAVVIRHRDTGRSKGFGFVTFTNEESAAQAVEQLDGTELDGRPIKVNIAQERDRDAPRRPFNPNNRRR